MVISTLCRSCGRHMDIRNGQPIVRPKHATRLASPGKPPVQHPSTGVAPKPEKKAGPGLLRKLFQREQPPRLIDCYHCSHHFGVVAEAQSSQCPKCGGYISLRDYVIDHAWRRRIQTRGDVKILKEGSIIGVKVQCHDLTVLGKLVAPVDCSGVLCIRSHGKIVGNVTCGELRVERGAHVEFQGEVHAQKAYIDGDVKVQLTCTGTIILEKKAHLQGLARAGGLVVKSGAKHSGIMDVVGPKIAAK
jgi:cytoskeletal protein CcmA (bactofilin family)